MMNVDDYTKAMEMVNDKIQEKKGETKSVKISLMPGVLTLTGIAMIIKGMGLGFAELTYLQLCIPFLALTGFVLAIALIPLLLLGVVALVSWIRELLAEHFGIY